ncbi:MAG: hypothetical protein Q9159_006365 [Coniocarpon cinnabarinum]
MLISSILSISLMSLASAAPQQYGHPYHSPSKSSNASSSYDHNNATYARHPHTRPIPQPSHVTITDHVTVTDHVIATGTACAGANDDSIPSSSDALSANAAAYVPNTAALVSIASAQQLPQTLESSPALAAPAATQTLIPATRPDHNPRNLSHLAPSNVGNLYYSSNDDTQHDHTFADLGLNYTKPAVVLEHSSYISNITCSDRGLVLHFNDGEGYEYAKQQWPSLGGDFILVSHSDGCNNVTPPQRTFWQVHGTTFDDDSQGCNVESSPISIAEAAHEMKASWGSFDTANGASNTTSYVPTSVPSQATAAQITPPPSPEDVQKRGLWGDVTSEWGKATSKVGSVVSDVTSGAESVWSQATSEVISALDKTFSTDMSIPLKASATAAASAPWSNAAEIVSVAGIDAYCVDCGMDGQATISGMADISFAELKIKSGAVSVSGNMEASLGLGLQSEEGASFTPLSKKINIVQIPLSPLEIPEILVIGPYLNVDASASVSMEAEGKMLMEVGASMPNFEATLDLVDGSNNKASGFEPQWTHKFDVEGATTVTVTLGLPVELGVGLDVKPKPDLSLNVSLTNTFAISGYGNYSNQPGPCDHGIGWGIHLNEDLTFAAGSLYSKKMYSWQSPDVASGCVPNIGGQTSNSTNTTSPSNSTTSGNLAPTPKTPGSSRSSTGKLTGSQYTPTYSPATPIPSTATGKHSGQPYSPSYSTASPTGPGASSTLTNSDNSSATSTPGASGSSQPYSPSYATSTPTSSSSGSTQTPSHHPHHSPSAPGGDNPYKLSSSQTTSTHGSPAATTSTPSASSLRPTGPLTTTRGVLNGTSTSTQPSAPSATAVYESDADSNASKTTYSDATSTNTASGSHEHSVASTGATSTSTTSSSSSTQTSTQTHATPTSTPSEYSRHRPSK